MSLSLKLLILSLAASAMWAADKDNARFAPGPASSYPTRLTIDKVTIAAVPYHKPEQLREAFGKLKLSDYGVLPVLMVIQNDSNQTLRLDRMRVDYISPGGARIEATPASEVRYLGGGQPRRIDTGRSPIPGLGGKRKNPLDAFEIEGRAFAPRMLPAGESANGFFYFRAAHREGARLYVAGIVQAGTGKELFYFEIPLEAAQ